jgi:hypothetical protein
VVVVSLLVRVVPQALTRTTNARLITPIANRSTYFISFRSPCELAARLGGRLRAILLLLAIYIVSGRCLFRRLVGAGLYRSGFCGADRHILAGSGGCLRLLRGLWRNRIGRYPDCASSSAQAAKQENESDVHRGVCSFVLHKINLTWRAPNYVLQDSLLWLSAGLKELKAAAMYG